MKQVIYNIGMLATPRGTSARGGRAQGEIAILRDAWICVENGVIASVGIGKAPEAQVRFDANAALVTPGLVDPHTHLVFGGWREQELAMKLRGIAYLDILAAGGGIHSTVRNTRVASECALKEKAAKVLDEMLKSGVTTCEAKSGYGLTVEDELRMLRITKALNTEHIIDVVSTFMGAHAVPFEYKENRGEYIRIIIEEMIPRVAEEKLAEFCDVFCETGVFSTVEAEKILRAGLKYGLFPKCHSDEIDAVGGTEMAGKLGAVSCEHLIHCRESGIKSMVNGNVIACCLPATSFYLNADFAPARDMINAGVPVAFGSDFNPGSCPVSNLQIAMNIGCYKYRMTPEECLTAVTLNAAAAIRRSNTIGTIEAGKTADIVIWDAENLDYIFYRFGNNLVRAVFKAGILVVGKL